jgi:High potential iron-sulfur protein
MDIARRRIVNALSLAAGAAALPCAAARAAAGAAEPARLSVKDPAAIALGYVENASQVDVKKFPKYVPDSNCENCLQLQGIAGDNYRPCSLFPGKLVSVSGWCSGWTPEM